MNILLRRYYKNLQSLNTSADLRYHFELRSEVKRIVHNFFRNNEFTHIERPVLTRFIRDSSNKVFRIQSPQSDENSVFDHPVYLNHSGKLHLTASVGAVTKVYSLMPCFQPLKGCSKNSKEFLGIECEEAFLHGESGLKTLCNFTQKCVKSIVSEVCSNHTINNTRLINGIEVLRRITECDFHSISFDEAESILRKYSSIEIKNRNIGHKFHFACEQFLIEYFGNIPLFVTHYPYYLKPFDVARKDGNSEEVLSFSLLVPGIGELVSGYLKEPNVDLLKARLTEYGAENYFDWYLEMKSWGCPPSGGFIMGLERLLMLILQEKNISNVIPFPRTNHFCPC